MAYWTVFSSKQVLFMTGQLHTLSLSHSTLRVEESFKDEEVGGVLWEGS